eukprot:2171066-Pyramimonas_sp.AAC.1
MDVFERHLEDGCRIVLNNFALAGLAPHVKVGKIEMMLHLHGHGSAAFRRHVFHTLEARLPGRML